MKWKINHTIFLLDLKLTERQKIKKKRIAKMIEEKQITRN